MKKLIFLVILQTISIPYTTIKCYPMTTYTTMKAHYGLSSLQMAHPFPLVMHPAHIENLGWHWNPEDGLHTSTPLGWHWNPEDGMSNHMNSSPSEWHWNPTDT